MKENATTITAIVDNAFGANKLNGLIHTAYAAPACMAGETKRTGTNEWCYRKLLHAKEIKEDSKTIKTGRKLPVSLGTREKANRQVFIQ
jgi:hypothetical protein